MMELSQRQLSEGLTLTAVQTDKFKTSTLSISFLTALTDEEASAGALLPALLRRGCQSYPDMLSLSAKLDALYGGIIEPIVRKKGETQCIGFLSSFLDDTYIPEKSNVLEQSISLLAELLLHPAGDGNSFMPEYVKSEKENLIHRIRSRINDKQQYAIYRLIQQMCQGEGYGVDKLGDEIQASKLTNEGLWCYYQRLLSEHPIQFYYCGSASPDQVEAVLRNAFAPLFDNPRNPLPQITASGKTVESIRYFGDRMDVSQGKLVLGFRLDKPYTAPKDAVTLQVFNAIYGGSTNAKLFLNVRERLSLCYYASSMAEKHKGLLLVSSGIAFDQYDRAKDEILAQLDDCRNGQIHGDAFESARRFVKNNLRLTADSQGRLEEFCLGQAVSDLADGPDVLEAAVDGITIEEIAQLAQNLQLDSVYFLQGKE